MDKKQAGKLGGQKKSQAKEWAAWVNGAKGGRKRTRTLADLLRRKVNPAALRFAFFKLTPHEQGKFKRYFGVWQDNPYVDFTVIPQRRAGPLTPYLRGVIRKLVELAAKG